jgi:hypothetical protein
MKVASVVMSQAIILPWFVTTGLMEVFIPVGFVQGRSRWRVRYNAGWQVRRSRLGMGEANGPE